MANYYSKFQVKVGQGPTMTAVRILDLKKNYVDKNIYLDEIAWYEEIYEKTCCLVSYKFPEQNNICAGTTTTTTTTTTTEPPTTQPPWTTDFSTTEGPSSTASPGAWDCGNGNRAPKKWKDYRCSSGKDHYCADNPGIWSQNFYIM